MKIKYYENDLPENLDLGNIVAIDTETMGLNPARDKLCLIQLSSGNGVCHLLKIIDLRKRPKNKIEISVATRGPEPLAIGYTFVKSPIL